MEQLEATVNTGTITGQRYGTQASGEVDTEEAAVRGNALMSAVPPTTVSSLRLVLENMAVRSCKLAHA